MSFYEEISKSSKAPASPPRGPYAIDIKDYINPDASLYQRSQQAMLHFLLTALCDSAFKHHAEGFIYVEWSDILSALEAWGLTSESRDAIDGEVKRRLEK